MTIKITDHKPRAADEEVLTFDDLPLYQPFRFKTWKKELIAVKLDPEAYLRFSEEGVTRFSYYYSGSFQDEVVLLDLDINYTPAK